MKTTAVTVDDVARSVLAVPPLARHADLTLNRDANAALIRHLEGGGVRTLMYGGNANFYHIGLHEYAEALDLLAEAAGADSWVIPSAGPDFGKMMDQVAVLRERAFPTAMVLPLTFPATPGGAARGIRRFAEALGRPVIVYIKFEGYLTVDLVRALCDDGLVAAIKYAVVRPDPADDPYLARLVDAVGRDRVISGIGERPAIVHMRDFGLPAFTSGSVCVAPAASMRLLAALKAGAADEAERIRAAFLPLEDLRDALSPIRVLHDAVTGAGIADMGPMLPLLENLPEPERGRVAEAARALLAYDRTNARVAA
ncbi:dihydrodipicolinate synthase family protein [Azospirillum sp. ST 5-10]|uniref:dihydrodipicolinate synthase family protein n=1 Tax=unclassified Azospirillum TaxID=2630922 RepID=UPI003F49BC31